MKSRHAINQNLVRMNQNLVRKPPTQTITSQLVHEIIPLVLTVVLAVIISASALSLYLAFNVLA